MKNVQVILWKHSDGSGLGVVRVYENPKTAEADLEMLRQHCDDMKFFVLVSAEYSDA